MVSRTAPVQLAAAMVKVEVPTAAGVTKPVDAGEVPALSTLSALRVIDQPTIAWGQQPAVLAVAEAVFNPVSVFPLLPVLFTFAAFGRVGTGQQVSKLEVSSGNGTAGMAASVGRWLAARGLPANSLTDQRPFTQSQTLVQFRNGCRPWWQHGISEGRRIVSQMDACPCPGVPGIAAQRVCVTDWITTLVTGMSWYARSPVRVVVGTTRIWSTTSRPCTTLPNTA